MQSTKDKVLELLKQNRQEFYSGQEMADRLFVTRAAVWKAIKALQAKGIKIEAVSNKGYRLSQKLDSLDTISIFESYRSHLIKDTPALWTLEDIVLLDETDSTNDVAGEIGRKQSIEGCKRDKVILAETQRNGRGRRGRSFISPKGTGLYMSLLLHPDMDFAQATRMTCIAAVAVCRAIEKTTGVVPLIKWVNDLFVENRKIAGILTEGHTSMEDGGLDHMVIGIGINVCSPGEGWPEEISRIAGSIQDSMAYRAAHDADMTIDRNLLAGVLLAELENIVQNMSEDILEEYRSRSMLIGKYVQINPHDNDRTIRRKEYAMVTGIDDNFHLQVRYENGTEVSLSTGEVSVVQY